MRRRLLRPGFGTLGEGAGGGIVLQLAEQGGCLREGAAPPQRQGLGEAGIDHGRRR